MKRAPEKHDEIEPHYKLLMNDVAGVLDEGFRPYGFALLIFPFDGSDGRMNYISNASRAGMVKALRELIRKFEAEYPECRQS